jgi:ribonuclease HI
MSTQTFGATLPSIAVHNENCNPLHRRCLLMCEPESALFYTEDSTMPQRSPKVDNPNNRHEPHNRLDVSAASAHRAHSGQAVMSDLVAYVDGGSLGNPGPSGIGVVINGCEGGEIRIAKWIGHQDNNVAEYAALMEALQCALALNATKLHVYSDSEVMVRQMRGEYTCRSPRLYSLHWTCRKLARSLSFSISHVPRENNAEANRLANSAVRRRS